jgi:Rod binding domain-containing protein
MEKIARMLALTHSPSPTQWERGVGAHGCAPLLPRLAGEGDQGGEGNPALLRACKEFEAIFVLQLWRAMQRTVPTSRKTLNYTEMFDLQFADYLSRQGRFGLAEQLYAQLSRYLPDAGEKR